MAIVTGADVAEALGLPATTAVLDDVAAVANAVILPYLTSSSVTNYSAPITYDGVYPEEPVDPDNPPPPVKEAGIAVAIDVYQSRTAAGGQNVGIDGTPGPYRMGSALLTNVAGLLAPWLDQGTEIG